MLSVNLSQEDIREINKLRELFSKDILVKIQRSEEGGFYAEIETYPGCVTEAETISELLDLTNDCVRTYLEIPAQYISFMPEYLAPAEFFQEFGTFPSFKKEGDVRLQLVQ